MTTMSWFLDTWNLGIKINAETKVTTQQKGDQHLKINLLKPPEHGLGINMGTNLNYPKKSK